MARFVFQRKKFHPFHEIRHRAQASVATLMTRRQIAAAQSPVLTIAMMRFRVLQQHAAREQSRLRCAPLRLGVFAYLRASHTQIAVIQRATLGDFTIFAPAEASRCLRLMRRLLPAAMTTSYYHRFSTGAGRFLRRESVD